MIFRLKIIFPVLVILLFLNLTPVFGDVKLDGVTFTYYNVKWSFSNNLSLSNIVLQSDGIILQPDESSEPRKYSFISNQQLDVTLVNLTNNDAKFSINTPNITDTRLIISGSKLSSVTSGGQPSDSWTWSGVENSVNVGSGDSIDVSFPDNVNPIPVRSGSDGNNSPPTFLRPSYSTTYPFSIDGTGFFLPNYSNNVDTTTLFVGKPVVLKLSPTISSSSTIAHLGLYTNIRGDAREIQDSDTYLVYDKGSALDVHDPHGYFSSVNFTTTNVNETEFTFLITFSKPMEKSDLIVRTWDNHRNSADVQIQNLWQVVNSANEITSQKPDLLSIENKTSPVDKQDADLILQIKEWGGYSSKSISDSELLANLGINAQHIPSWFMKTTPWVLGNEITLEEFVNAIRYMHENQIIN